jgi:nucleoid DNA-binding protein
MENVNVLIRNSTNKIDVSSSFKLKDADVVEIWDEVASYIEKSMLQTKGVTIPGFGTFSFVQKKLDVGNNKFLLIQRPVFSIAEKFAQTHGLQHTKYPVTGSIPVLPLNYSAIANETRYTRDDVELCVKHVLQVFNRSVQSKKNVEFTFNTIGKMQIRDNKVKMKFFKEFVNSFDSSGKVLNEMQNVRRENYYIFVIFEIRI